MTLLRGMMTAAENAPTGGGVLAATALFALGFAAAAGLLHGLLRVGGPDPLYLHADIRSEKLRMLGQARGTVWSAVFGSSHVHLGFDPRVFDRAAAGSALATRTLNLAIEGGSQTEQRAMALEYLKQLRAPQTRASTTGGGACLVMLELNAGANFTNDHLIHPRAINIYDWPATRFVSHLVSPSMGRVRQAFRVGYGFAALGLHEANVGMLSSWIFAPPLDRALIEAQTRDDRRGFKTNTEAADRAEAGLIEHEIATAPARAELGPNEMTPGNAELIEELETASPVRGIGFAYVVMPKISDLRAHPAYPGSLQAGDLTVPVIDLARPERFPELYRPGMWHDRAHLNDDGAAVATELVERGLAGWYAIHGGPPACGGSIAVR